MNSENAPTGTPVEPLVMPCLFCGSHDIDAAGWANGKGDSGPQCLDCGVTGESVKKWNDRDWLIDRLTNAVDEAIRKGRCGTYDEWQSLIASQVEA